MTKEELNAIKYLTIGVAKETFKQDYESFSEEDDDYIKEKLVLDSYCEGVEDVLWILENMKQKPNWIPVSEKLPQEGTFVLASYKSDEGEDVIMTYYNKYGFIPRLMTAWMPLPEPYKEDKE